MVVLKGTPELAAGVAWQPESTGVSYCSSVVVVLGVSVLPRLRPGGRCVLSFWPSSVTSPPTDRCRPVCR